MPEPSPAAAWLDDFFASYYAHRPVNGTFIGVHDGDDRLPDLSENGAGDTLADMRSLLDRSRALDLGTLEPVEAMDVRLARGFLEIQSWEYGSEHFHRGNPSTHTGEAIFGVMSLFLTDFAPVRERMDAAVARLAAIPGFLDRARDVLVDAHPEWTRRAQRECSGMLTFLGEGIDLLGARDPARAPKLRAAADRAAAAFDDFAVWLETDLARRPRTEVACGEEAFSRYLRHGHFLDRPADDLVRYARGELERAHAALDAAAHALGAATPDQALAPLADVHPPVEGYYQRYSEIFDETRGLVEERGLLTWPDAPLRFVPQPAWARGAAPELYFLFYRAPAAFGAPAVHEHLVTPIEPSMPEAERTALLRATNDSVIRLNHVVHHAGPGHHVQNWHASRSPSRVGRVAAVDCASRIAMFCGGTMAEGWACYVTDVVGEAGGFTPLERCAELRSRVRMCARAIVDIELHHGRMSVADAAAFYHEHAAMPARAALGEAVKNSMFPGAALMYLIGSDHIHRLRREAETREGAAFSVRAFHDRFLSLGSVPVTLAGEMMAPGAP